MMHGNMNVKSLLITLFIMGTEFFIYAFLIYARFLETQVGGKTRAWCIRYISAIIDYKNFKCPTINENCIRS